MDREPWWAPGHFYKKTLQAKADPFLMKSKEKGCHLVFVETSKK